MSVDLSADRYIDLAKHHEKQTAYCDFENLAFSPEEETSELLRVVDKTLNPVYTVNGKEIHSNGRKDYEPGPDGDAQYEYVREILIHMIGEAMAMNGEVPGEEWIAGVMETAQFLVNLRYLMKSTAE
jgi:hypothetical protein